MYRRVNSEAANNKKPPTILRGGVYFSTILYFIMLKAYR